MSETLYLCLDLQARPGVVLKTNIDPLMPLPALLANSVANGVHFERNWQCFKDVAQAKEHASSRPTLVLIPIVADMVPIEAVQ